MKALIVKPGFSPQEINIEGLEAAQRAVGGRIEAIYPYKDLVAVIIDEDGKTKGRVLNREVPVYGEIAGPFLICGVDLDKGEFCSLKRSK